MLRIALILSVWPSDGFFIGEAKMERERCKYIKNIFKEVFLISQIGSKKPNHEVCTPGIIEA